MKLESANTNREKIDALRRYVVFHHEQKEEDWTCQHKGGQFDRFCKATTQKTCAGCRFYSIGLESLLTELYDIVSGQQRRIFELEEVGYEDKT